MGKDDYEDAINRRKGYELSQGNPASDQPERKFILIDTPGLNDTQNFDEIHISSIFKALKGIRDIHLVLITVSNNVLSDGVKDALTSYVDMLPDFKGILAFVHTHIEYKDFHPANERFFKSMEGRKKILGEITNTKNVPHFMIDCDLSYARPIQACITQNTIRNILSLAQFNRPIRLMAMATNRAPKMAVVDMCLKDKYKAVVDAGRIALGSKNQEQGEALRTIGRLKASICEKEERRLAALHQLSLHGSDELVLLDQMRFEEAWSLLTIVKTVKAMIDCKKYIIDCHEVLAHNILFKEQDGGRGKCFWSAKFRRRRFQDGVLHTKLYIKKRKKHEEDIQRWELDSRRLPGEIDRLQEALRDYEEKERSHRVEIQELLADLEMNQYLLNQVSKNELDIDVFHELVDIKAYIGNQLKNLEVVEKYYLDNRTRFENQARIVK
ncbi:hypothetical protein BGX26_010189 [Mortierella sp. AD094]|nr:hypothetical protein BGX26_010189 [Mortierella sp. AD094]